MKHLSIILIALLCLVLSMSVEAAESTLSISYQGTLVNAEGNPAPSGPTNMNFSIFTGLTGGSALWSDSYTVNVGAGGVFTVVLGPMPTSVFSSPQYSSLTVTRYLEIQVPPDPPMSPRSEVTTSPYAAVAKRLTGDLTTTDTSAAMVDTTSDTLQSVTMSTGTGATKLEVGWSSLVGDRIGKASLQALSSGGRLDIYGPLSQQQNMSVFSGPFGNEMTFYGDNARLHKQFEITGGDSGGMLGIWGSNGTNFPIIRMEKGSGGAFARFSGPIDESHERVEIEAASGAGRLGIWGTNGTAIPKIDMLADATGGSMALHDSDNVLTMYFNGGLGGDASCILPYSAISDYEIENEPGLVQQMQGSCTNLAGTTMEDLEVATISIPTAGYLYVQGNGMVEFSGTTGANRIDVQIDETAGGSYINGYYSRIGLADYVGTSYSSFNIAVSRLYYKSSPGAYTFRMEARRLYNNGTASVCFPKVTIFFYPTSYGSVQTFSNSPQGPTDETAAAKSVAETSATMKSETTDLRQLELRARAAREAALQAELDLIKAKMARESQTEE